ncbi:MAG: hypothetical protein OXK17_03950 [Thaumarchaeota archaeon]|nr:hypothetical protein [Nitrososphaerota archaeon]
MPSWARDATEFTVSVTRNVTCGTSYSYVPKPVLKKLGDPRYLTFRIKDETITVEAGRK